MSNLSFALEMSNLREAQDEHKKTLKEGFFMRVHREGLEPPTR